jgi:hypothetical protein
MGMFHVPAQRGVMLQGGLCRLMPENPSAMQLSCSSWKVQGGWLRSPSRPPTGIGSGFSTVRYTSSHSP